MKWMKFFLFESLFLLSWHLIWVIGFNPVLLLGMLYPDRSLYLYANIIIISVITATIAHYTIKWKQKIIWIISLILVTVTAYFILTIDPYDFLLGDLINDCNYLDVQFFLFNIYLQLLLIIFYNLLGITYHNRRARKHNPEKS